MATVNELKEKLKEKGIAFPAGAKKSILKKLLADAEEPKETTYLPEDENVEEAAPVEEEITETETHFKGANGRWYRKKRPAPENASVHDCHKQLVQSRRASEVAAAKRNLASSIGTLEKVGFKVIEPEE